jgi:hypothetical protein
MNLAGLVLELLVPGAIATIAVLLGLYEMGLLNDRALAVLNGVFGGTLFGICAYINGFALRHVGQWFEFMHDRYHYPRILNLYWRQLCREIIPRISDRLLIAPVSWGRETEESDDQVGEGLIIYLREYIFANKQPMLSQYLTYQWNLARMARNSILPLLLLAVSFAIGVPLRRPSNWVCWLGFFWALVVGLAMFRAYKQRLVWLTGVLMRFAAFEFAKEDPSTAKEAAEKVAGTWEGTSLSTGK